MSARRIRRAREREAGRSSRRSRATVGAGAALGATALMAPAADAGTFTVTSLDDSADDGTLRGEIIDANQAAGDDVIVFQSGLTGTIELDPAEDAIAIYNDGLQVQGPGAGQITVDANDAQGIFYVHGADDPNEQVSISGLTLTEGIVEVGGAISAFPDEPEPADLTVDGVVITNSGALGGGGIGVATPGMDLTITNSVLSGNEALSGGGVFADETTSLTIANSTLSGNEAEDGGGLFQSGSSGTTTIEGSVFSDNTAYYDGGGANLLTGTNDVVIRNSTFSGNVAEDDDGGGVYFAELGAILVDGSTFDANTAGSFGGGLNIFENSSEEPVTIRNSTVSGNSAAEGGGVFEFSNEPGARTIHNSTITGNSATERGGGVLTWRDGSADSELGVSSTIIANNSADDEGPDLTQTGSADPVFATGFSLVEDTADADITESPAGSNLLGVDPLLGPLASNGGPTQTHAPALGSPAIDKGLANGLATDQRGLARTGDLAIFANATGGDGTDIGSVEIQAADCKGQGALKIDGTPGDDTLTGTGGPDAISGADGADRLNGVGAPDCLNGDAGRDRLNGGGGADRINGGSGRDKAKGQGGRDNVRGGGGKDQLKGGGGKDKLRGQGGKDKLVGGGGKDKLKGGGGKDKLRGQGAKDKLKGQGGKDKINAVDGKRDKVNCGGSRKDRATVDPQDKVSRNCERVIVKD